jgi:hypothetical protein
VSNQKAERGFLKLFKNEGHVEGGPRPKYTGMGSFSKAFVDSLSAAEVNADGEVKMSCAGWIRQSANGKTYISISANVDTYVPQGASPASPDNDDDIPF